MFFLLLAFGSSFNSLIVPHTKFPFVSKILIFSYPYLLLFLSLFITLIIIYYYCYIRFHFTLFIISSLFIFRFTLIFDLFLFGFKYIYFVFFLILIAGLFPISHFELVPMPLSIVCSTFLSSLFYTL